MKEVLIPEQHYEYFDENSEEFVYVDVEETKFTIEHSLISLRKWESKWKKPFLKEDKTKEEMEDYVRCMTLTHNIDPKVYKYIPDHIWKEIIEYIEENQTATWFNDALIGAQKTTRELITAEIIYFWMISLSIPIEFQKWHLSQLLTLIKVVNIKSQGSKNVDKVRAARERAKLNEARRKMYNTKG